MVVFHRHGADLVRILEGHADAGTPLDLQELFFRFTLDSISEIAYGVSIGSLHDPSVPFLRAFDDAQATIGVRGGRVAFYDAQATFASP